MVEFLVDMKSVILVYALAMLLKCDAKQLTAHSELVEQLRSNGFPEDKLRDWVCLVEKHSSRHTDALGKVNKNGSTEYGLFQVNNRFWCSATSQPGKDCNVTCADLLTDDITKAAKCAKKVYNRHGFNAWYGWKSHCQVSLPDISAC